MCRLSAFFFAAFPVEFQPWTPIVDFWRKKNPLSFQVPSLVLTQPPTHTNPFYAYRSLSLSLSLPLSCPSLPVYQSFSLSVCLFFQHCTLFLSTNWWDNSLISPKQILKAHTHTCCNFLCVVLAAAVYLKYRQCRLSCLPFVWDFFSLWHTHTHTHTHARTRLATNVHPLQWISFFLRKTLNSCLWKTHGKKGMEK